MENETEISESGKTKVLYIGSKGRVGKNDGGLTEDGRSETRSEGKDGHMDVIPVQDWIWKAVMVCSGACASSILRPDPCRGSEHLRRRGGTYENKGNETDKK